MVDDAKGDWPGREDYDSNSQIHRCSGAHSQANPGSAKAVLKPTQFHAQRAWLSDFLARLVVVSGFSDSNPRLALLLNAEILISCVQKVCIGHHTVLNIWPCLRLGHKTRSACRMTTTV